MTECISERVWWCEFCKTIFYTVDRPYRGKCGCDKYTGGSDNIKPVIVIPENRLLGLIERLKQDLNIAPRGIEHQLSSAINAFQSLIPPESVEANDEK